MNNKTQIGDINFFYPVQVWITTLVLGGPIVLTVYDQIHRNGLVSVVQDFAWNIIFIPFGMLYSLPVLALYYFIFRLLTNKGVKALVIKIILCLLCIAGILVTLNLIHGSMIPLLSITYSCSVVVASFVFKIYRIADIIKKG